MHEPVHEENDNNTRNPMCVDTIINVITAACTLALAAVAIWQDQVLSLLNPAKGNIAESNFDGKEEGDPAHRLYCYHVKAISRKRWRPLKGTMIRFRQINRVTDPDKEEKSIYPVWRQLPWAPEERCEARQTISSEQECDLGRYEQEKDRFAIAYYKQGGEFNPYVTRGQVAHIFLHLCADNLRRDAEVEVTIDLKGPCQTKPTITLQNVAHSGRPERCPSGIPHHRYMRVRARRFLTVPANEPALFLCRRDRCPGLGLSASTLRDKTPDGRVFLSSSALLAGHTRQTRHPPLPISPFGLPSALGPRPTAFIPTNPRSDAQMLARNFLANVANQWRTLTPDQRSARAEPER